MMLFHCILLIAAVKIAVSLIILPFKPICVCCFAILRFSLCFCLFFYFYGDVIGYGFPFIYCIWNALAFLNLYWWFSTSLKMSSSLFLKSSLLCYLLLVLMGLQWDVSWMLSFSPCFSNYLFLCCIFIFLCCSLNCSFQIHFGIYYFFLYSNLLLNSSLNFLMLILIFFSLEFLLFIFQIHLVI